MALYTEAAARACVRNRDGQRVFYLGPEDRLTPGARDFLQSSHIPILPASEARPQAYRTLFGATLQEKPEHMTHLAGDVLVLKDHPRIRFRGAADSLEAELLLAQRKALDEGRREIARNTGEILDYVRRLIACDVLNEPVPPMRLCGMDEAQIRTRSHNPAEFYGIPHFMPSAEDPESLLALNRVRTAVRTAELAAYTAFRDRDGGPGQEDMIRAWNRLSSLVWILMIRIKAGAKERSGNG